ncbi:hypothetical protein GCM10009795_026340 [Nocardioides hankookensis]|uniref:Uncharacterized protein n=1 Tax=Nocardioides hankookensis TaxID=443157 RepID=A0ABW1LCG4_9ACTN
MTTPDSPPVGDPPPPERDHYTINSFKRTLCAALLIRVSQTNTSSESLRKRTGLLAIGGSLAVVIVAAIARAHGLDVLAR